MSTGALDWTAGHPGADPALAEGLRERKKRLMRKQLSDKGAKVQIHTIRGVGYLIAEEKRDPV